MGYTGPHYDISYDCMWIYNYLKVKQLKMQYEL